MTLSFFLPFLYSFYKENLVASWVCLTQSFQTGLIAVKSLWQEILVEWIAKIVETGCRLKRTHLG